MSYDLSFLVHCPDIRVLCGFNAYHTDKGWILRDGFE
jgi:hypothetical protein